MAGILATLVDVLLWTTGGFLAGGVAGAVYPNRTAFVVRRLIIAGIAGALIGGFASSRFFDQMTSLIAYLGALAFGFIFAFAALLVLRSRDVTA